MNRLLLTMGMVAVAATTLMAQNAPQLGKDPVAKVVAAMTNEEKASFLVGTGMAGFSGMGMEDATKNATKTSDKDMQAAASQIGIIGETHQLVDGAAGTSYAIPRLGIPSFVMTDGPAGVRINPTRKGTSQTYYCTAFPVGILLASTWNKALVNSVGKAMGNEVLEYGCDVLLAPAMNIHRSPLCGRNFEYYSEDPYLAGEISASMVKGLQSNGVGVSVKHFAANNQEIGRMGVDSRMSARALREIYLRGFERVVKEANPWTIMSSYNKINGTYTSQSYDLLTTILRDEWGFKGMVMTDWMGGKDAVAQIKAGNDLLMPGMPNQKAAILKALNDGTLSQADANKCITRILNTILISPRYKKYAYTDKPDLKAHAVVTRNSASEGMVLLKNDNNTLPLAKNLKKIAAFGYTSYDFIAGGGGSGDVNEAYTISLVDGLQNAGFTFDNNLKEVNLKYLTDQKAKQPKLSPLIAGMILKRIPDYAPTADEINASVASNDIAFITIGRNSTEGNDRQVEGDFNLSQSEQQMMKNVCEAYHKAGKKVVVILNVAGVIETASWKELPDAILLAWQGGQEGGNSVADILTGKVNPSGKLPSSFPMSITDVPSTKNFPDASKIDAMKMMTQGFGASGEKKELEKNTDYTNYEEGIYVGYRYFDSFGVKVSYPFGYGMSYTKFTYSNPVLTKKGNLITVSCTVTNSGKVAGKEVVELYVAAPGKTMEKPAKELRGFAKTALLQPGKSQVVTISFTDAELASFDEASSSWVTESGNYQALIAASATDIRLTKPFTLTGRTIEKVHKVMLPQETLTLLKK